MPTLERAMEIAVQAHKGFVEKAGRPYILHPLRLMMAVQGESAMIAAVLHDVVEDSVPPHRWDLDDLGREGFSEEVLAAVDCVTRRDETWDEFIERIRPNPIARVVKLADLRDNMDILRLREVGEKDLERLQRYLSAWHRLSEAPGEP